MFDYFESQPVRGKVIIDIQVNQDKKYRKAELSLSFSQYTLPPPPDRTVNKDGNMLHNVNLWGILVKEDNPPVGVEPLKWMLTTNLPIDNIEKAIQIMNWYKQRWNIELFHKILKSGCTVESAQLRSRDKLIKYITVSSIIAWRIFWLSRHIENEKDSDCSAILTRDEQIILFKRFNFGKVPTKNLTTRQAYLWIAKLGGYIGRKSDPPPGMISIWRGWTRLMAMLEDYQMICG